MPRITNAKVQVRLAEFKPLPADYFGNNAAIQCPACSKYPVLLIARQDQRGSSESNPAECRGCGAKIYIADDLNRNAIEILTVAVERERH